MTPSEDPIRFRAADEFRARPAWRDGLDPATHQLQQIIGDYSFSKQHALPCGLKGCRTPHQKGYVVQTVDGLETHIGNVCGGRYFNVHWGEIRATFDRAAEDRDRRLWLEEVLRNRDTLIAKASALRTDLLVITAKAREIAERFTKEPLLSDALARVARDGGAIRIERTVDAATVERLNLPQSQRMFLETVGRVTAIDVIGSGLGKFKGDKLAIDLRYRVIDELERLSASSLRSLNERQRKLRTKDIERVKATITEAEMHLARTQQFLSSSNLREFSKLPIDRPNSRTERTLKHFATLTGE